VLHTDECIVLHPDGRIDSILVNGEWVNNTWLYERIVLYSYSFDSTLSQRRVFVRPYVWKADDSIYVHDYKYNFYTYDTLDRLTQKATFANNQIPGAWVYTDREEYSYTATGKIATHIVYFLYNGNTAYDQKYTWAYDSLDRPTGYTMQRGTGNGVYYIDQLSAQYIYLDTNSSVDTILTFLYDGTILERMVHNYSNTHTIILTEKTTNGGIDWLPLNETTLSYSPSGHLIYKEYETLPYPNQTAALYRHEYDYSADGLLTEWRLYSTYNQPNGELLLSRRVVYSYTPCQILLNPEEEADLPLTTTSVIPNPASDYISVQVQYNDSNLVVAPSITFTLLNTNGYVLQTKTNQLASGGFEIGHLLPGIYFVQIKQAGRATKTLRFVKH
jgi:Secretion system C-terminal sorting domain